MNNKTKHALIAVVIAVVGGGLLLGCGGSTPDYAQQTYHLDRNAKDPCRQWVPAWPDDESGLWYRYKGPSTVFWNPETGSITATGTAPECDIAQEPLPVQPSSSPLPAPTPSKTHG